MASMAAGKYGNLNRNQLIQKLIALEGVLGEGGGREGVEGEGFNEQKDNNAKVKVGGITGLSGVKESMGKTPDVNATAKTKKSKGANLDFTKTLARKVALRISYLGTNYYGFSSANPSTAAANIPARDGKDQPSPFSSPRSSSANVLPTIEGELFKALMTCRLIPSPEECEWSKAGRTDKGKTRVSGFGQVVSLWVRTKLPKDHSSALDWESIKSLKAERAAAEACMQVDGDIAKDQAMDEHDEQHEEYPYLEMLNRLLPNEIRVLAWSPVPHAFDARFSCLWRQYKYFFPSTNLDLDKMQQAAQMFVGSHDCRYICKIDPSKAGAPSFFMRDIYQSVIEPTSNPAFSVYVVKGRAFLWHQVRNMMALLFMVGQGLEDAIVVSQILKPDLKQGKPNYEMAPDAPLVLLECGYGEKLKWRLGDVTTATRPPSKNDGKTMQVVQELWTQASLRVLQLDTLKEEYLALGPPPLSASTSLPFSAIVQRNSAPKHVALLKRTRADSVDAVKTKTALKKRAKADAQQTD